MTKHCSKCGTVIPEGLTFCPSCSAPVEKKGFWARFFGGRVQVSSNPSSATTSPGLKINFTIHSSFKIRDTKTGETRTYGSLEEAPAEYREKIQQAQQAALSNSTQKKITVTDASGQVHAYQSISEMPPELRTFYEKAGGK